MITKRDLILRDSCFCEKCITNDISISPISNAVCNYKTRKFAKNSYSNFTALFPEHVHRERENREIELERKS